MHLFRVKLCYNLVYYQYQYLYEPRDKKVVGCSGSPNQCSVRSGDGASMSRLAQRINSMALLGEICSVCWHYQCESQFFSSYIFFVVFQVCIVLLCCRFSIFNVTFLLVNLNYIKKWVVDFMLCYGLKRFHKRKH